MIGDYTVETVVGHEIANGNLSNRRYSTTGNNGKVKWKNIRVGLIQAVIVLVPTYFVA